MNQIRILVADDNEFVRRAICAVLRKQPDIQILCEVDSGMDAVEKSRALQPDVVILDVSMPELGGFEAARQILAVASKTEVVLLTEHAVAEMARAAMKSGIRGYVVKSDAAKDLVDAVRTVMRQEAYLSPALGVAGIDYFGKSR